MNFLGDLIYLIARIWQADSEMRDSSRFGESEFDKRSRRFVGWLCGGAIGFLLLLGLLFWCFS